MIWIVAVYAVIGIVWAWKLVLSHHPDFEMLIARMYTKHPMVIQVSIMSVYLLWTLTFALIWPLIAIGEIRNKRANKNS